MADRREVRSLHLLSLHSLGLLTRVHLTHEVRQECCGTLTSLCRVLGFGRTVWSDARHASDVLVFRALDFVGVG